MTDTEVRLLVGVAALVGVVASTISQFIASLLTSHTTTKRERLAQAVQAGLADHAARLEHERKESEVTGDPFSVLPSIIFIHGHYEMLTLIHRHRFTEGNILKVQRVQEEMQQVFLDAQEERRAAADIRDDLVGTSVAQDDDA